MKTPTVVDLSAIADDMRDVADAAAAAIDAVNAPETAAWIARTHWIAAQIEKGKTP